MLMRHAITTPLVADRALSDKLFFINSGTAYVGIFHALVLWILRGLCYIDSRHGYFNG